ncbi:MAG: LacI family DNA-binding transcriptional regulator [Arachnia sp.]
MSRVTISDVAHAAGVSKGAVSFALNDRPGVSEQTRDHVKRVARELGWTPNMAAVALSVRQARAVGLVIGRPTETFTGERFFMQFIAGIERVLTARSRNLVLKFVGGVEEEMDSYRQWWSERRVDGVILTDPRVDDPRPELLEKLGLPGVLTGTQQPTSLPRVLVDDGAAMCRLVDHMAEQGHTRLAHVSGSTDLAHTRRRAEAFTQRCAELGIVVVPVASTDFLEESGRAATETLLGSDAPPSGIIFDNEVLMMGGLIAIAEAAVSIPQDVAIASFEDSPMCHIVRPQITALSRDPADLGAKAATLLLDILDGHDPTPVAEPTMELSLRGSTVPGLS